MRLGRPKIAMLASLLATIASTTNPVEAGALKQLHRRLFNQRQNGRARLRRPREIHPACKDMYLYGLHAPSANSSQKELEGFYTKYHAIRYAKTPPEHMHSHARRALETA